MHQRYDIAADEEMLELPTPISFSPRSPSQPAHIGRALDHHGRLQNHFVAALLFFVFYNTRIMAAVDEETTVIAACNSTPNVVGILRSKITREIFAKFIVERSS